MYELLLREVHSQICLNIKQKYCFKIGHSLYSSYPFLCSMTKTQIRKLENGKCTPGVTF